MFIYVINFLEIQTKKANYIRFDFLLKSLISVEIEYLKNVLVIIALTSKKMP